MQQYIQNKILAIACDLDLLLYFHQELLDDVRTGFHIGEDQAPGGVDGTTKEMLTLHHAGANLDDDWVLTDLGLTPGKFVCNYCLDYCLCALVTKPKTDLQIDFFFWLHGINN